ncbi:hypothetical protein KFK09_020956 [Dendrobium nobile]|uniref:Uncharacterized protein n=1 Tax=Dendrobium nobile TaxID=94219 RepID=A0A8T3APR1_DENNO|nr:hypothetical protein KFK09_020956 [Dendrobium nobile]
MASIEENQDRKGAPAAKSTAQLRRRRRELTVSDENWKSAAGNELSIGILFRDFEQTVRKV